MEIQLKADIDQILKSGTLCREEAAVAAMAPTKEDPINFKSGIVDSLNTRIVQVSPKRKDKVYDVSVVSDGDPLEIYTDKEGSVIFRKYSLMGGLAEFASQLCEILNRTTGRVTVITDRDNCIAAAGATRKEALEKAISPELERLMEGRQIYQHRAGGERIDLCAEGGPLLVSTAAPILSEGDVMGCVLFVEEGEQEAGEVEYKLCQSIAAFLGKHLES